MAAFWMPYSPNGWRDCSSVGWDLRAGPVNPNCPTMQEVIHPPAQRFDDVARALEREADHVDHDGGPQGRNTRPEGAGRLGGHAVDRDLLHRFPGRVRAIRLTLLPADIDDFVAGLNQAGHQVRADMPVTTYDHNSHSLCLRIPRWRIAQTRFTSPQSICAAGAHGWGDSRWGSAR